MSGPSSSDGLDDYQLKVYTSETSHLSSWSPRAPDLTDTVESVVGRPANISNQDFFDRVASQFGAVTTFSQISDANHIIVKLSQGKYFLVIRLENTCILGNEIFK